MGNQEDKVENDLKYKQYNDNLKNNRNKQNKNNEDKIRFDQSSMDIYICGKYEPFMNLLIILIFSKRKNI